MNELEFQNLHEHVLRQSVSILIIKCAFAWLLLAVMDFGFDMAPVWIPGLTQNIDMLSSSILYTQSIFHLLLNFSYGWLMLFLVLSWVFEYYIISKDSIVVRKGIIFSHEDIFQMEDVKTLDVSQGFVGKILKIGTIEFFAYRAQKQVYLSSIDHPYAIASLIHSLHPQPETVQRSSSSKFNLGKVFKQASNPEDQFLEDI